MPVPRNAAAIDTLSELLINGHQDRPDDLVDYPGYQVNEPGGWLWHQPQSQPGLQQADAYDLTDAIAASPQLHAAPAEVLDDTGGNAPFTAEQQRYCRASLDVTMKGGTTSGVIYPLALCELARDFRFRNLGGASAGAIAASMAAAAELGRVGRAASQAAADTRSPEQVAQGRVRQGFAGMADIVSWLTQRDQPGGNEQYRLVQLFKPTLAGLPLFRVLAAAMRKQFVRGALLLLISLNGRALIRTLLPFVLAPLGLSAAAPWTWGGPWWSVGNYLWAVLLLWLAFGWLIPLTAFLLSRPGPAASESPTGFGEPVPVPPPPTDSRGRLGTLALALVAGAAWVVAALYAMGWVGLLITVVFLLAEVAFVLVGFGTGIVQFSTTAKDNRFGLIGGSGAVMDDHTWRGRLASIFDRAAKVLPEPTVQANLTDWLTQAMADLAGLAPDEVLRFGHLWVGRDFVAGDPDGAGRRASDNPRHRSINLELMSTELIRRAPYRFPLPAVREPDEWADDPMDRALASDQLYFDAADLAGLLPVRVIEAMTQGQESVTVRSLATGTDVQLYRLPQPWDLPVVFATRASLALPALFQAIRLYELRQGSAPVRTEFGARVATTGGDDLRFPDRQAGAAPVAQELWLTDGGVTSNFPIHMFDSPLPLWPTVGIDLGRHPAGGGHQDVYLLGDAHAAKELGSPLGRAMSSFFGAILGTSLQWRDNAQLLMPAFQARIAVVRQRGYEGGNNLFMTRADVASLALRGVLAGMRLRRRFASDAQWQRQQWLRLRVAAENLVNVADRLQTALREQTYTALVPEQVTPDQRSRVDALIQGLAGQADPNPPSGAADAADPGLDWYLPAVVEEAPTDEQGRPVGFFANLTSLVSSARYLNADLAVLRDGAPLPLSELRQVPRS